MHSVHLALLTLSLLSTKVIAGPQVPERDNLVCTAHSTVTRTVTITVDAPHSPACCSSTKTTTPTITARSSSNSVTPSTNGHVSSSSRGALSSSYPSAQGCSYWLEIIQHQGIAAFNSDSTYKVFRDVKDYGAKGKLITLCIYKADHKGDGVTDDTVAINAAISAGNRCGPGTCAASSTSPALVSQLFQSIMF
jgi:glucan 1,3-beta-glucosidase